MLIAWSWSNSDRCGTLSKALRKSKKMTQTYHSSYPWSSALAQSSIATTWIRAHIVEQSAINPHWRGEIGACCYPKKWIITAESGDTSRNKIWADTIKSITLKTFDQVAVHFLEWYACIQAHCGKESLVPRTSFPRGKGVGWALRKSNVCACINNTSSYCTWSSLS